MNMINNALSVHNPVLKIVGIILNLSHMIMMFYYVIRVLKKHTGILSKKNALMDLNFVLGGFIIYLLLN